MKILHYTLGLPPYRSGGLTKYTHDLMKEQVRNSDDVYLLFPGRLKRKNTKVNIKLYKVLDGIKTYELINPLPVPLMNGIHSPELFMQPTDYIAYKDFFTSVKVEIINLHTLMGLHKEFLIAAKELNIPIIYTTHDYFGLCTKVNFLDSNFTICEDRNSNKCANCNLTGDKFRKIKILQSREYRFIKNLGIINKINILKSRIPKQKKLDCINRINSLNDSNIQDYNYELLLNYYKDMFNLVDNFIFNSQNSKKIYSDYLDVKGEVLPITHNDIKDKRIKKIYNDNSLKITYLGPDKEYKGFYLLIDTMRKLEELGYFDIKLNIYGNTSFTGNLSENIKINGRYVYSDLEKIFDETDLLIVPSRWYETFGFITLEALSYGVPVLVTDKVGSKDILEGNYNKGIIINDSINDLLETIISIYKDKTILKKINNNIIKNDFNLLLDIHYYEVKKIYNHTINKGKKYDTKMVYKKNKRK